MRHKAVNALRQTILRSKNRTTTTTRTATPSTTTLSVAAGTRSSGSSSVPLRCRGLSSITARQQRRQLNGRIIKSAMGVEVPQLVLNLTMSRNFLTLYGECHLLDDDGG
mmetsp:Transcript_40341/g.49150  ORF Transcript_40341/g.49150 Transcript_40341/m.49150 type:complete len:109 (+) Transcript_40341:205-531(+)